MRTIQDIKTRWNSSYLAWERLLKLQNAINILIATMSTESDGDTKKDLKRLKEIMLSEEEWKLMQQLTKLLKPFNDATKLLGGEKYATASFMYYVVTTLLTKVMPAEIETVDLSNDDAFDDVELEDGNEDDIIFVNESQNKKRKIKIKNPLKCNGKEEEVKKHLYQLLLHYWESPAEEGMISALLDPRTKGLTFVSNSRKEEIISFLHNEYQSVKELEEFTTNMQNNDDIDILESNNSLLIDMFAESQNTESEINEYLSIPQLPLKTDPFKWWAGNQNRFPILSYLTKKYLSISATSTSSERLFSQAGNTMTAKRTQLKPKLFEKLLFLKKNHNVIGKIFPSEINEINEIIEI